ncbi:MAG TPA: hypothetical protein VGY31_12575 [Terriglobia bacterium]|nr:hypothetical protein [Terriglobia bacterium]
MELSDAFRKVGQILDDERSSPTVKYSLRIKDLAVGGITAMALAAKVLNEPQLLQWIRSKRPREVKEDPENWMFESVNYSLLCALLSQLREDSRKDFTGYVLSRLSRPPGCVKSKSRIEPSWNSLVSEFPLIAEFCIRNGAKENFFRVLGEADLFLGHAVLLRHLEDMIALNFTALTDQDYEAFIMTITTVGHTARIKYKAHKDSSAKGAETAESLNFWGEIIAASDGIKEECRKARYFYLKGALLEGLNLEVNQDKTAVEGYLKGQGFSDRLIECLNHAEAIYHSAATGFEFKTCMGHLRSFMEQLHSEGLAKLRVGAPHSTNHKWGKGLILLREAGVLSKAEEGYASALYILVSDEGVHPVIAEKEYARLARNVVIEYALLFLRVLERQASKYANSGG